jgi:hypothetical protein
LVGRSITDLGFTHADVDDRDALIQGNAQVLCGVEAYVNWGKVVVDLSPNMDGDASLTILKSWIAELDSTINSIWLNTSNE